MGAGFTSLNSTGTEFELSQYKTCVLSILLYGLEVLVLGKEELKILGAYYRKELCCVRHLSPSTDLCNTSTVRHPSYRSHAWYQSGHLLLLHCRCWPEHTSSSVYQWAHHQTDGHEGGGCIQLGVPCTASPQQAQIALSMQNSQLATQEGRMEASFFCKWGMPSTVYRLTLSGMRPMRNQL